MVWLVYAYLMFENILKAYFARWCSPLPHFSSACLSFITLADFLFTSNRLLSTYIEPNNQECSDTMASEMLRMLYKFLPILLKLTGTLTAGRIEALLHRWTYKSLPNSLNIVIIGGSYTGIYLARRLAETIPSGYKVILIEKNSHFNHVFNFPRYSVMQGSKGKAFVPYDGLAAGQPTGAFERIRDTVVDMREGEVVLESGKVVEFEFLAIVTGTTQPAPVRLMATDKEGECEELRTLQTKIQDSKTIAIVGAGAVGVQLAGDIKSFYPEKDVTIAHSRAQLLPTFGKRLHDFVSEKFEAAGIRMLLEERPVVPKGLSWESTELTFKDGRKESFDLVVSFPVSHHKFISDP